MDKLAIVSALEAISDQSPLYLINFDWDRFPRMSFTHRKPIAQGQSGRSVGIFTSKNGTDANAVFEWTTLVHRDFSARVSEVKQRIPTSDDVNRPEEARTLKIESIFCGSPAHIIYQCPQPTMDLYQILEKLEKPSGNERRALACSIATQVRSIHVHFQIQHTALRTESFVFLWKQNGKPDFERPFLLDWTCPPSPVHQHPDYQADKPVWFYDVWSLMMVLSEIAEWKPLSRTFRDEEELRKMKAERRQMATHPGLRGQRQFTAAIFQKGFGFLDKDRDTLENLGRWEIKRFFDELCSLLVVADQ
ncbi:hypothetical protein EDB81DRAFT_897910 [Dactylonectria macrodidyma]|uniref:Protein kinase domain-containing protein n=1 Tax=Dactylonectria macrodidyma TaxID=307937 RepID=A0A9P9FT17_9HYPO|nr:hypothetical protein EDB81DRAFT_897910 [Dactylonectria macrodidyma]